MGWFSPRVRVTLVNHQDGSILSQRVVKASTLPEAFDDATSLSVSGTHWMVVEADPPRREQFARTRQLTVRLQPVVMANPADVLFSLPSIWDRLPKLGNSPVSSLDCLMHEDDWRQVELVASEHHAAIDAEFLAIRKIHETQSVEQGSWRDLHVRTMPESPIPKGLSLDEVKRTLAPESEINGVSFRGQKCRVADRLSLTTSDGLCVYGLAPADEIEVLGIVESTLRSDSEESIRALEALATQFDLGLICWCRCQRISVGSFRDVVS